jgi:hypothetical protein
MISHNTILNPEQIFLRSSEYTILNNGTKKSDISFNLKTLIKIPNNVDAFVQLDSFKCMNTFYNINSTNNIFYFSVNGGGYIIGTINNVVIPIGNYTISSLMTYINTQLTTYLLLTYDNSTFKITFTSPYNFIIRSGENSCNKLLGLNNDDTVMATTLTSPNLINLAGVQVLYITLGNITILSNSSINANVGNVLESINIDVLAGSSKNYNNISNQKYKINEIFINNININIYDENNNLVDFNNSDWFMTISVIFSYKNEYKPPTTLELNDGTLSIADNLDETGV